ncbi:MAG: sulfite exporter TauE/SafE family protein, partial [Colwellia sp.]|nr:sulfite exporter TauE/SafE family protein [Colwellia sp.]
EKGKLDIKGALPFAVIALLGALIGAYFASIISPEIFKKYLAIAMIFVVVTLFIPKKKDDEDNSRSAKFRLCSL